jgi:hypothetical protein
MLLLLRAFRTECWFAVNVQSADTIFAVNCQQVACQGIEADRAHSMKVDMKVSS